MKRNIYNTLFYCIIINAAYSQFIEDRLPDMVPNNLHGQLNYSSMSLFDPERFDIQQGFSMSMMSLGNQSVSVAGYTNNITYWASENLRLSANILLYQPSISSFDHQGSQNNGPRVAFETGLIYRPTKNSFLEISFKNLPNYGLNNSLNNHLSGRRIPGSFGLSLY